MERKAEKVGEESHASQGRLGFTQQRGRRAGRVVTFHLGLLFTAQAQGSQAAAAVAAEAEVCPVCAHNKEHPDPFTHPTPWLWDVFILPVIFRRGVRAKKWNSNQACSTMSFRGDEVDDHTTFQEGQKHMPFNWQAGLLGQSLETNIRCPSFLPLQLLAKHRWLSLA